MYGKPPMRLQDAIEGYLGFMDLGNCSQLGISERKRLLGSMVDYARQNQWPDDVNKMETRHVVPFIRAIKNAPDKRRGQQDPKPTSDSYYDTQFSRLSAFFNWAVRNTSLKANPMDELPKPKVIQTIIPTLSQGGIASLFEVTDPDKEVLRPDKFRALRNRAALSLLADTPIRRGELVGLRLEDINLEERQVKVLGKGGKERHMWYGARTADVLREYMARRRFRKPATDGLWIGFQGRPSGDGWVRMWLKNIGDQVGIPDLHPHRFRHTWTMRAIEMDINERVICRIAGWTKLPETYIATLGDRQAKAAQMKVSPLDRMGGAAPEEEVDQLVSQLAQHLDQSGSEKDYELLASLMEFMAHKQR
jgi:site-specific recombinase XerC